MTPKAGTYRATTAGAVLAAVVAGALFAPVFPPTALVVPVGAPAVAMFVVAALCRRPALSAWRPVLTLLAGLLAVVETCLWPTTVAGLPTTETVTALRHGITLSWQQALQSTWPARPEADLVLFVPLLVVVAGVLGVELLHRTTPLAALLPSLAVIVLAQAYTAESGWFTVAAGLVYVVVAGCLLTVGGTGTDRTGRSGVPAAVLLGVVGSVTMLVVTVVLPSPSPRYALRDTWTAPLSPLTVESPLDRVASRLATPDEPLFRLHGATAGHWPLVVLDTFDGVTWRPGTHYRRFGSGLRPGPEVAVPVVGRITRVELLNLDGPWLPSRTWPARVEGAAPLVDQRHGSLLVADGPRPREYTLTWWDPEISAEALADAAVADAAVDGDADGGLAAIGAVPPEVADLAERAVGDGRPTFRTALLLERYLRENYTVVGGDDLTSGHSWPQLTEFLLSRRSGTSEQFAAAYVVLARIRGIPVRLAVGFRVPEDTGSYTVHNRDVEAWPEVAVDGVGWVPLDPTGAVSRTEGATGDGLTAVTERARDVVVRHPAPSQKGPEDRREPRAESGTSDHAPPVWWVAAAPLVLVVGWFGGLLAVKAVRRGKRRRLTGAAGVLAAWEETRDLLRSHGVRVTPAMTVRDLADAAEAVAAPPTVAAVRALAAQVDHAVWAAPRDPDGGDTARAWATVDTIRRGLARRGWRARLRAALDHRTLRAP